MTTPAGAIGIDWGTSSSSVARAGLTPPAGCERGLCRACACTKRRGATETSGSVDLGATRITLCTSFARGDVEIDV